MKEVVCDLLHVEVEIAYRFTLLQITCAEQDEARTQRVFLAIEKEKFLDKKIHLES